tara:strand:+ start:2083 stop:2601 length:519 start_codon:yes stop_codon:yes gene_type:complete
MKKYIISLISLTLLLMVSCGSDESTNSQSSDSLQEPSTISTESVINESIEPISNSIIGTWVVDVDMTINEMQQSLSFINQTDKYKEFMLGVMNETLPNVRYSFFDDGTVENNSPIIGRATYNKTIWNQKNNKVTMTVILENSKLTYQMNFKNSNEIKMTSTKNDQVFHLIRI